MPELNWQKSSFSGGPEGNCLHIAAAFDGSIRLCESDSIDAVLTATPRSLAALLQHTRSSVTRQPHDRL
ncbi:hypothetical protein QF026_004651 [Streptomyces aurantiacus]|uniref:DUF397 domain-containing protein n=1 Tax=Streptomyces aurantiacus TaxID=47760 RepID=UPI002794E002|nr:DUF397 domain-containing protein [Streptomyces aurantiacus]MDQ0776185.1 hypothetical protein [Streptomyces aurantiacus]